MLSVLLVSAASLIGILALAMRPAFLDKILFYLVSFAAGALLGAAFLDLLPEAVESAQEAGIDITSVFLVAIAGLLGFFVMEKFLHWYHCHKGKCEVHTFHYLNLAGDALHNFIDGMVIAASFLADYSLGVVTTIAIVVHEIPQEIGDYAILVYGGFDKIKALFYNFLTALSAFAGALLVLFVTPNITETLPYLLSFGAGGFIYIASTDLLPELHKHNEIGKSLLQFALLILGVLVVLGATTLAGAG